MDHVMISVYKSDLQLQPMTFLNLKLGTGKADTSFKTYITEKRASWCPS